ncbi:hypothetical protein Poly51_60820 [Rubripirellula tenax]|uniref:TIGR00341 family protein n=1 Tax=Rubripirellula tenax TaxID=2528015 RepID=A0A5C6EAK1_9BACT|nr:TIGR00341 family protein [Rubripirellula tenax]TWU44516.1 hypothetical protein Poly51_60820 [Rubripirellula tenax]
MALRLVELVIPATSVDAVAELASVGGVLGRWDDQLAGDLTLIRMLVDVQQTELLLDDLEHRFGNTDGFRVILLPIEATLPRPAEPSKEPTGGVQSTKLFERISREELYHDIAESADISWVFATQVVLATMVAAVGLIRDDTAIIIGAMVIAPLLGPNMSLCFATCLGDIELARRALKANAVGLTIALAASLFIGLVFAIDPEGPAVASRTSVSGGDIVLALASGCAGVLAFTAGAPSALIGVMVAVALLPPFAVFGLLLANGEIELAVGALMLVATNVICVNLAGVLTFQVQGVRPRTWWEADRAKKAMRVGVATWSTLLLILIALIALAATNS